MEPISLLIIDGHPLMCEALRILLQAEPGLEVIGAASDGPLGVSLSSRLKPDIVVMDLLLPGLDGLEAIRQILVAYPEAQILIFSSLEDEAQLLAASRLGAQGYVPKTASRAAIIAAIHAIQARRRII